MGKPERKDDWGAEDGMVSSPPAGEDRTGEPSALTRSDSNDAVERPFRRTDSSTSVQTGEMDNTCSGT